MMFTWFSCSTYLSMYDPCSSCCFRGFKLDILLQREREKHKQWIEKKRERESPVGRV